MLSACQDNETTVASCQSNQTSSFTSAILEIWDNGNFAGNYDDFHQRLLSHFGTKIWTDCSNNSIARSQKPKIAKFNVDNAVDGERPFIFQSLFQI